MPSAKPLQRTCIKSASKYPGVSFQRDRPYIDAKSRKVSLHCFGSVLQAPKGVHAANCHKICCPNACTKGLPWS